MAAGTYTDPTYNIGRYYDPATGQFLTVDRLADSTGQPYGYATGDPVDNIDPLGLASDVGDGAGPPAPSSLCAGATTTDSIASCVASYLVVYNALTSIQAAAIVGNLQYESGYFMHVTDLVCAFGACGGGIAQWLEGSTPFEQLQAFGGVSGSALPPLGYQVEFLSMQLDAFGKYSNGDAVNAITWMTKVAESISSTSGQLAAEVKAWELEFEKPRGTLLTPAGQENTWQGGSVAQMSFAGRVAAAKSVLGGTAHTESAVCPGGEGFF
jgi:uncharacterized protein RhaS with RHS repeats